MINKDYVDGYKGLDKILPSDASTHEKKRMLETTIQLATNIGEHVLSAAGGEVDEKDFKKAREFYRSAEGYYDLAGKAYTRLGNKEKAEDMFRVALEAADARGEIRDIAHSISGIIGIIGATGFFYFLSSNITGLAVSNMTTTSTNIAGIGFLITGIIGTFLYFKNK